MLVSAIEKKAESNRRMTKPRHWTQNGMTSTGGDYRIFEKIKRPSSGK
jgi:hypothetical protein